MTEILSNRPGKAEPWPKQHRKLTMQLNPSDKIFFRQEILGEYLQAWELETWGMPAR